MSEKVCTGTIFSRNSRLLQIFFLTRWSWLLRHVPVWLVLGLNRGWGHFYNFLAAPIFTWKCVFFAVSVSLHWLNIVSGVYLVQVPLLLIGQHCWGHFFRYRPVLLIGWRTGQIVRQRQRKKTNTSPTTLNAIQAESQPTFIKSQFYSTCD